MAGAEYLSLGGVVLKFKRNATVHTSWLDEIRSPLGDPLPRSVIRIWSAYVDSAQGARFKHGTLEITSIIAAALIPALSLMFESNLPPAILGAVVVAASALRPLFQWKENWLARVNVRYEVEREVSLYAVGEEPYGDKNASRLIVRRVEEIAFSERQKWVSRREEVAERPRPEEIEPS